MDAVAAAMKSATLDHPAANAAPLVAEPSRHQQPLEASAPSKDVPRTGWDLSEEDVYSTLEFSAAPIAAPRSNGNHEGEASLNDDATEFEDDGGWGNGSRDLDGGISIYVDPASLLCGPASILPGTTDLSDWAEAGFEISLRRVVSSPPTPASTAATAPPHFLAAQDRVPLVPVHFALWDPAPAPFLTAVASVPAPDPEEAFVTGVSGEEVLVAWLETKVAAKLVPGMGVYGKWMWMKEEIEEEAGAEQQAGEGSRPFSGAKAREARSFWVVDMPEVVISSVSSSFISLIAPLLPRTRWTDPRTFLRPLVSVLAFRRARHLRSRAP